MKNYHRNFSSFFIFIFRVFINIPYVMEIKNNTLFFNLLIIYWNYP